MKLSDALTPTWMLDDKLDNTPWYAFIMPWEVPPWYKRGKWKKRHRRIAALEYKLGLADSSWRNCNSAEDNLGLYLCGEVDYGW